MNNDKTAVAVAVFDKLANLYQDKFMDVSMYDDSFNQFCDNLPQKARVLELACGPGNITRNLLDKRPDLDIYGTDLSPNMVALAKINNPEAQFGIMDSRDMLNLNKKYHGIMCGFCLPYLSKEEAMNLIADAAKVLYDNGILYISTMEDDYSKSGFEAGSTGDQVFMHYHEASYLSQGLKDSGFGMLYLERKAYMSKEKKVTDLLIIAIKKINI